MGGSSDLMPFDDRRGGNSLRPFDFPGGGGNSLMPFDFPGMGQMFQGMDQNRGNCHSFSSSTVMTMTNGPDGRPQVILFFSIFSMIGLLVLIFFIVLVCYFKIFNYRKLNRFILFKFVRKFLVLLALIFIFYTGLQY